jgi:predicted dehydrogenase
MMQTLAPIYHRNRGGHTLMHYRIVGEAAVWPPSHRHAVTVEHESTIVHEVTHIFDLLNWITGELPTSIYTTGAGHIDNVIVLTYGKDITASITAGDNGTVGYNKERFEINTHGSTIIGDMFVELLACNVDGGKRLRRLFPYQFAGKTRRGGAQTLARQWWQWRSAVTPEQLAVGRYFGQTPLVDKGHAGQLEQFRRDILAHRPHTTDAVRGALATVLAWKAIESWRRQAVVTLDHQWIADLRGQARGSVAAHAV